MSEQVFAWRIRVTPFALLAITVGGAALFLFALLHALRAATPTHADAGVRYIDRASGTDTTDCSDPDAPCASISHALAEAIEGDIVLVARGVYSENLFITKTVSLEGGYEPVHWSRSFDQGDLTTIDGGQISAPALVISTTKSARTIIDGFTITRGDGGIFTFSSSVAITNCKIIGNDNRTSTGSGGGMRIDQSDVTINNTLVAANLAANHDAGIRVVSGSDVKIFNSTIAYNHADLDRHGIFCSLSPCLCVNCIVWGHNLEDFTGHMYTAYYSDIEMELSGEGNIAEDPHFIDPTNGDYHLRWDSPCIDAGTNEYAAEIDLDGDPRPIDGDRDGIQVTDMGMDEVTLKLYLPMILNGASP